MVRVAASFLFALAAALGLAGGCSSSTDELSAERRACGLRVWHKPKAAAAHVEVVGDWNGWSRPGVSLVERSDGWRVAEIHAPAGEHAYAIVEDGEWLVDPNEPMTAEHDGHEVSLALVPDCERPAIQVESAQATPSGDATVTATFVSARAGARIDLTSVSARGRDGALLRLVHADPAKGKLSFEATGLMRGKYTYTIAARDVAGRTAEDARATVWVDGALSGAEPWDPRDAFVYQVVLDRYRDEAGPLAPPKTPSSRAGGTLAGVRRALESGELEALGVSALWLSPLYANPDGEFSGTDGRLYSSYHGYWPKGSRELDARFASESELDAFVALAHGRGMRVLFDVVPNHVHEQHPWTKQHPDWFRQDCICGQPGCDWGSHIETCWFTPYMPDVDLSNVDAARAASDEVLWWFDRWDADGIRIDAVPMMPRSATRRIATSARRRYAHPGHALYILGENFTGPGGYESLRYDLGPYGLDGAFHFPLMWTLREAIARESQPMSAIVDTFHEGEASWRGAGAVMGLMIGNHDVSRFASVSAGNDGGDTWTPAPQPLDQAVYAKQRLALSVVLTLPGAPVLYYGDEVGLAGKSDPDCRRVMPAEDALTVEQRGVRELVRALGRARSCSRPLRRGAFDVRMAEEERIVFLRTLPGDGEFALVVLNRRPKRPSQLSLPSFVSASLVDVVTGARVEPSNGTLELDDAAYGVHVYVPAGSACAAK